MADHIEENDDEEVSGEVDKEIKKFKYIFNLINRYVNNKFGSFSQSSIDDTKHKKVKLRWFNFLIFQ